GVVRLKLQIGTDGHVQRLEVVNGHPLLVPAALDAVKQWVYAPVPSAGSILLEVPFSIDGSDPTIGRMAAGGARNEFIRQPAVLNGVPGGVRGGVISGVPGGVEGGIRGVPSSRDDQSMAPRTSVRRIRIGAAVQAMKLDFKVDPVYPEQARAAGIEGDVL